MISRFMASWYLGGGMSSAGPAAPDVREAKTRGAAAPAARKCRRWMCMVEPQGSMTVLRWVQYIPTLFERHEPGRIRRAIRWKSDKRGGTDIPVCHKMDRQECLSP